MNQLIPLVSRLLRTRLLIVTVSILVTTVLLCTVFFYYYSNKEIGQTYSQKIFTLTQFKEEIIKDSIFIYVSFAIVAMFGIVIFAVLFTHRIAGPLVRVKAIMQQIAEGNLDIVVKFRKEDVVHPLADTLNDLVNRYRKRYSVIGESVDKIHEDALEMLRLIEEGNVEAAEGKRIEIAEKTEEINKILSGIKL